MIVADALAAFPEPARQPLRTLADRVAQEGMAGALDIAIRRMFPEAFIAANPRIVDERRRALEKADAAGFRTACLALAKLDFAPVLKAIRNPVLVMASSAGDRTSSRGGGGEPGRPFSKEPITP